MSSHTSPHPKSASAGSQARRLTVLDFAKKKREREPISMLTCYESSSARILNDSDIDMLLVGDSVAMVMHGHSTTLAATTEMMTLHTAAVSRSAPAKFLVSDMPFLSYRKGISAAMECVDSLMKAGAHALKLEGVRGHEEVIARIVGSGVPVMGHLGLTPQSIHQLGGFRVQGRDDKQVSELRADAQTLQELGCFSLVLECVPSALGSLVSQELAIPTIGIGAGSGTDGQVLVLHDMLGMNPSFKPKFLRHYLEGEALILSAANRYHQDVRARSFPSDEEGYAG